MLIVLMATGVGTFVKAHQTTYSEWMNFNVFKSYFASSL